MNRKAAALAILCAFSTYSCATAKLWESTDPNRVTAVAQSKTSEAQLQEQGLQYQRDDKTGRFYVHRTTSQQFQDHLVRFLVAPAAVCADVAVVGALAGAYLAMGEAGLSINNAAINSGGYPISANQDPNGWPAGD